MGLLDDAIREHLDLKRRRGADPADVERAEREALGPVRRNREAAGAPEDADVADDALLTGTAAAYDQASEENWSHDAGTDEPGAVALDDADLPPLEFTDDPRHRQHEPEHAPDPDPEPQLEPERPAARRAAPPEPPFDDDDPFDDEPAFEEPAPRPPAHHGTGETAEYDVEGALASESGESDESDDMLEETPEFLQDTPDHDRLWFEQRPPKDFDFDG